MNTEPKLETFFAINILRLSRPRVFLERNLALEEDQTILSSDIDEQRFQNSDLTLSNALTLTNFGRIYVGDTFKILINFLNVSKYTLEEVGITATLQRNSKTYESPILLSTKVNSLTPNENCQFSISHKVEEPDVYMLNVEIDSRTINHVISSYYSQLSMPIPPNKKRMLKRYKFDAKVPLSVSNVVADFEDYYIVESKVKNESNGLVFLRAVEFLPSLSHTVEALSFQNGESVYKKFPSFKPGEVRNFLFRVAQRDSALEGRSYSVIVRDSVEVGSIKLGWNYPMGDSSDITMQKISVSSNQSSEVHVEIEDLPNYLVLEKPKALVCRVWNRSGNTLHLNLSLDDSVTQGIKLYGLPDNALGTIEQGCFKTFEIVALATNPGIQKVSGIKVSDDFTNSEWLFQEIGELLVKRE